MWGSHRVVLLPSILWLANFGLGILLAWASIREYLGKHASPYMAIVGLVVESVLPLTLSSIAFLISYGMGSQAAAVFSCIHPLLMCISLQMLILRVAKGEAWQKEDSESRLPPGHGDTFGGIGVDVPHPETLSSLRLQSGREDDQVVQPSASSYRIPSP
ncbi:hypothetical protein OG21DRAFT_1335302 [Imleria badia]|nr:hypothetical protein OG21DRAFT_1335302 [Imleria badia]